MEIYHCEQGSPEWFEARLGIPTASEFSTVLAQGRKKGDPSVSRKTYMLKLAGEVLTGVGQEGYTNAHLERGKEMEPEARKLYSYSRDCELQQIGFVRNGRCGASPDSLIGNDGGLEIKTALPHILIAHLLKNEFPSEHWAQVQGNLLVTERNWWDIAIYWPGLPMFVKRVYRDEEYLKELSAGIDAFNLELAAIVESIRRYGQPSDAELMEMQATRPRTPE